MITLYAWDTPNGRKVAVMLEEIGVPYRIECVDITKGEQFNAAFLAISPNNKIPAIVDDEPLCGGDPYVIFESGAILTYLANKSGKFLALHGAERWSSLQWLHWQNSALGPMLGQLSFFAVRAAEKSQLAITRFRDEACRLLGVLERRLSASAFLAGDHYTIADISCYPWMTVVHGRLEETLRECFADKTEVRHWMRRISERPAVKAGMEVVLRSSGNVPASASSGAESGLSPGALG